MMAHQNTWGECHMHRNRAMKDTWWPMHAGVREIGWGC